MKGRAVKLSLRRRIVVDFLYFGKKAPTVPVERQIDIAAVQAARAGCAERPHWSAIFAKAFAIAARDIPALRRAYLSFPFPHLYEYPVSVANLAIERSFEGEAAVCPLLIKDPAACTLAEISGALDHAKSAPLTDLPRLRTMLSVARLPWPLRRALYAMVLNSGRHRCNYMGTFGLSTFGPYGAAPMRAISPFTSFLTGGPFDGGRVNIRGTFDHRVLDGTLMARALVRTEHALNTAILDELKAAQEPGQVQIWNHPIEGAFAAKTREGTA
jgi:hypothetical protein